MAILLFFRKFLSQKWAFWALSPNDHYLNWSYWERLRLTTSRITIILKIEPYSPSYGPREVFGKIFSDFAQWKKFSLRKIEKVALSLREIEKVGKSQIFIAQNRKSRKISYFHCAKSKKSENRSKNRLFGFLYGKKSKNRSFLKTYF